MANESGFLRIMNNNNLIVKVFTFCLILTIAWILVRQKETSRAEPKSMPEGLLQIENSQGRIIMLPYSKPSIIKTQSLPEPGLEKIEYEFNQSFIYYLQILGPQFQFSNRLYMNWFDNLPIINQAQYHLLHTKYDLNTDKKENKFCILSPFGKLESKDARDNYKMFLKSMDGQNYSNFKVFVLLDEDSNIETDQLLNEVALYPRINNRMQIVKYRKLGDLGMKDYTIRNYCESGDIVLEVNAQGSLVGRQVLNLLNRLYQKEDPWFIYTNFIWVEDKGNNQEVYNSSAKTPRIIHPGTSQKIDPKVHETNSFRTWEKKSIKYTRSYLRDLYMKIPMTHLLTRGNVKYYERFADLFMVSALVQLAGSQHTFFYPDYLYLSNGQDQELPKGKDCLNVSLQKIKYQALIQTPLRPLKSLKDQPKLQASYTIPQNVMGGYVQKEYQGKVCESKDKGIDQIFKNNFK